MSASILCEVPDIYWGIAIGVYKQLDFMEQLAFEV